MTLDEISKLFDLCNRKGVESMKIDNIEFKMIGNYQPRKRISKDKDIENISTPEEAALFWSSQPVIGE